MSGSVAACLYEHKENEKEKNSWRREIVREKIMEREKVNEVMSARYGYTHTQTHTDIHTHTHTPQLQLALAFLRDMIYRTKSNVNLRTAFLLVTTYVTP